MLASRPALYRLQLSLPVWAYDSVIDSTIDALHGFSVATVIDLVADDPDLMIGAPLVSRSGSKFAQVGVMAWVVEACWGGIHMWNVALVRAVAAYQECDTRVIG